MDLQEKDGFKGRNALVVLPNALHREGTNRKGEPFEAYGVDVMLDHRDRGGRKQANPHAVTYQMEGRDRPSNIEFYSGKQVEAMLEAAGPNVIEMTSKSGEVTGRMLAVKGDFFKNSGQKGGVVLNTKTLQSSDFDLTPETLTELYASMHEARLEKDAAKQAPQAEAEAQIEDKQVSNDEPSL